MQAQFMGCEPNGCSPYSRDRIFGYVTRVAMVTTLLVFAVLQCMCSFAIDVPTFLCPLRINLKYS